jgi:hypothetical protein
MSKIWYSGCRRHDAWCLVELQPGAAGNIYDVRLGRDWFSYCTTTVPHAQTLLSDDRCLTLSSSCYRRAIYF